MKQLVCIGCSKEFAAIANRKYCSLECYRNSSRPQRKTGKTVSCDVCGCATYKTNSVLKNNKNVFCSRQCADKFQKRNKLEFVCKTCEKIFFWSKSRIKNNNVTYCSIACRNKDKEWVTNASVAANAAQIKKNGINKLEQKGKEILEGLNIEFYEQVTISEKFIVDVVIPGHNIVIQWDGDYWHGHTSKLKDGIPDTRQRKRMALDKSQDAYMRTLGYVVLRFWEHEVLSDHYGKTTTIKTALEKYI